MAEIKGGITVTGNSVDTMPVILDGRQSLYEEAIEKGTISRDTSYETFLERLAVKPSELSQAVKDAVDKQLDKAVKVAVDANLETAVDKAVAAAVSVAIAKLEANRPSNPVPTQPAPAQPTPAQPAPAQPTPAQPAPAQPVPAQPSTESPSSSADLSDDAFDEINKLLGNN
nr:MAG TPA: YenB [Caudoviricetes sp.]